MKRLHKQIILLIGVCLSNCAILLGQNHTIINDTINQNNNERVIRRVSVNNKKLVIKSSDKSISRTKTIWDLKRRSAKRMVISRHYAMEDGLLLTYCDCFSSDTVAIIEKYSKLEPSYKAYYFYNYKTGSFWERHLDICIPFKTSNKKYRLIQQANITYPERRDSSSECLKQMYKYYTSDAGISEGDYSLKDVDANTLSHSSFYSILVFIRSGDKYNLALYRILDQIYDE